MHKGTRSLLILLGGAAVIFLAVTAFFAELRQTEPVVVAKQTLSAGTRLTPDVLELRQVRAADALPGALVSIEDAAGQVPTIARALGDQLTEAMVGDEAASGIAAALAPETRAVAVHVNQASGLAGVLRVGDRVTVVAVVDPQVLNGITSYSAYRPPTGFVSPDDERRDDATPTPKPETPAGRVALVLLVVLIGEGFGSQPRFSPCVRSPRSSCRAGICESGSGDARWRWRPNWPRPTRGWRG